MEQLLSIALFVAFGLVFVLVNLTFGRLVRPSLPNAQKKAIYECGEPTIGSSWVQFDLRFYIVALFFLVFDVEVALIYAWAVVYRDFPLEAMVLGLPFLGIVIVGYVYEWYSGSLTWVRSSVTSSIKTAPGSTATVQGSSPVVGSATQLSQLAKRDPEVLDA